MYRNQLFIHVDDQLEIWVETFGVPEDEACIFISGAGANATFWTEGLCNSLAQRGFFTVRYDHRDFGFSSKIDYEKHPYDILDLVHDTVKILDALNIRKAHVAGHSMGGFIAQLMAINHPGRMLSMTSISSSTGSPEVPMPPDKTWKIFYKNKPQNDLSKDLPGFLSVWKHLNGTAGFDKELATEYTRNLYERQEITGALGASHVKAQSGLTDRSEALKKINMPVLVMHGEEDYLVDPYGGRQIAACVKNAELVMIPKMGHMPFNQEILLRFENEIIHFLGKHKIS